MNNMHSNSEIAPFFTTGFPPLSAYDLSGCRVPEHKIDWPNIGWQVHKFTRPGPLKKKLVPFVTLSI
jgi:hypothetical protein